MTTQLGEGTGDREERNKCEATLERSDNTIWQLIRNKVEKKSQRLHEISSLGKGTD